MQSKKTPKIKHATGIFSAQFRKFFAQSPKTIKNEQNFYELKYVEVLLRTHRTALTTPLTPNRSNSGNICRFMNFVSKVCPRSSGCTIFFFNISIKSCFTQSPKRLRWKPNKNYELVVCSRLHPRTFFLTRRKQLWPSCSNIVVNRLKITENRNFFQENFLLIVSVERLNAVLKTLPRNFSLMFVNFLIRNE